MKLLTKDKSFYKSLILLAIPMFLQNVITFSVNFADNLMVGSLGDNAIASVYMGNQIQTLLTMLITGIDGAVLIIGAQYWGRKDTDSIRVIVGIGMRFAVGAGLLLTALSLLFPEFLIGLFTSDPAVVSGGTDYLRWLCLSYTFLCVTQVLMSAMRSIENVKIGTVIALSTLVVNVSLNYVLIFGHLGFPALGVRGAAIATLISRIVETSIMLLYAMVIDKKMHLRFSDFFLRSKVLLKDFFRYGLPVVGGQLVWAVNTLVQSAIIGHLSTEATAAISMTGMLNNLVFIGIFGLSGALGIITGKTVGAGKYELMKEYAYTAQIIFLGLGLLSCGLVFFVKDWFISLYNVSPDALEISNQFMTVIAFTMIGTSYQATCLAGLVKAGGDTGFVFKNDTIFVFGVLIPSALIAIHVFHAPEWVVFLCLKSDQILKCFVAVVKINRFKWIKNLTRDNALEAETSEA